jgi:hypothetical protein
MRHETRWSAMVGVKRCASPISSSPASRTRSLHPDAGRTRLMPFTRAVFLPLAVR